MSEQSHAAIGIHTLDGELDPADLLRRRQVVRRTRWVAAVVLVLLALGAGRTLLWRAANARTLQSQVEQASQQYVKTTLPKAGAGTQTLLLPGTLQGVMQAPISARASGYLKRWTKDIGSHVERGELLAEIETPEIDQQLTQADAARAQAAASLALARSTVARWEALRSKDVVSQQELDERRSAVTQQQANLAAADANVQRLKQLEGFKRVLAPFAGIVTRRNVDVGDLIDAGSGSGGRALFLLSQTDPLRVYVNVPQAYSQRVRPGMPVQVTQAELRGRTFAGKVARTAGAIDAGTRTMQIEVALANPGGVLLPGAYVQVALALAHSQTLTVPNNVLLFRREGTLVALLDDAHHVRLRKVTLGRNFGQAVEVLDGLSASDRLVLNPPDSLAEGDTLALAPLARQTP